MQNTHTKYTKFSNIQNFPLYIRHIVLHQHEEASKEGMRAIYGLHSAIYRAPVKKVICYPRESVEFKQQYFSENKPGKL